MMTSRDWLTCVDAAIWRSEGDEGVTEVDWGGVTPLPPDLESRVKEVLILGYGTIADHDLCESSGTLSRGVREREMVSGNSENNNGLEAGVRVS